MICFKWSNSHLVCNTSFCKRRNFWFPNRFWDKCKFMLKSSENFENFWKDFFWKCFEIYKKKIVLWSLSTYVIPQFRPFRSISNSFWNKCKFMIFEIFQNLWYLKTKMKFPFRSISYCFWVLNLNFKNSCFKNGHNSISFDPISSKI